MKKSIKVSLTILAVALVVGVVAYTNMASVSSTPTANAAAVDYFLKLEGIDGESQDPRHKGEIDVESWSWGESNFGTHGAGSGGGAGKVSMNGFHFTMNVSKASPLLMLAKATGDHIKRGTITVRRVAGEQTEYIKITLTDVMVTSYGIDSPSDGEPVDQLSLNFSKIEFEYTPQNPDGSAAAPVKAGYDLKMGKKI